MVSVFSVHVQIEDNDKWNYSVKEDDHLGSLSHDYTALRTVSGLKLHRKHVSAEHAFRTHEKTLHYDHLGTLHTADARDNLLLRDRSRKNTIPTMEGEKPHRVHASGDFPDIEAHATVKITLNGKRPRRGWTDTMFHNLTAQTLETKPKPDPTYRLEAVQYNITRVFTCLRQFPQKDNEKRSVCVNDLRYILGRLHSDDFTQFVSDILAKRCPSNDALCEDKRLVLIDVVTRLGDVTSQELIVTHVLSSEPPVDEELRRVFVHCAAMEHPAERFVNAVEQVCFGKTGELHGSRAMTRTQSRACLAVGSLVRHSHHAGHSHTAHRLLDRLESWLEEHSKGDPHISKRDTWMEETEHEPHHVSKAVLLHALGNAAMSRSRHHLMLHATPNRGHQMWRRAALDALRKYNCTETATVMLDSVMHDEKHTVRQKALSVYVTHPRRHEVAQHFEHDMLSEEYTYPAVARVKRNLFDRVLFKFKIELPSFHWKKELGSSAVGASFGATFENKIDALFRVLNGYVDLHVHDKVWAEIHLGLIHRTWDIFLAEVCYSGRLSYNMNIVKDFTVGMMKDISGAFDHIANRIIEPMEKAANDLASRYQDKTTNQPKSGFEPVTNAVKELPKKTGAALQATIELSDVAESVSNLPLVTKIQQLASRAQSLMEDVNTEATDLFTNIKDAAVVALPFAEKEVRKSLNTVLGQLGSVSEKPKQAFTFIERAKMGYHLAMQRIVEGSNIIKQSTSFLSGSRSSFMNSAQELLEIAETTKQLVTRLTADHARRKRKADLFGDIGGYVETGLDIAMEDIKTRAEAMADHLINATESSKNLQKGFDQQALYVEILKTSYQAFKEAIDMVKSRINALFGQKFHPQFPVQRRDCDGRCKCGYYPTDCSRYEHPGVDLKWDQGWKIPSPVAGLATRLNSTSISIKPATSGFTDYEIIMSNINLLVVIETEGTFVDAGQIIAESRGNNGCEDPHFHLAMKRNTPDSESGLCYYVDPSPFLDHMQPIPKWTQECKEFTFKHIGDTIDFSNLTKGFSQVLEALERVALDVGKQLLIKAVDEIPDNAYLGPLKILAKDVIQNVDPDPSNLKNIFKDALNTTKDFFRNIRTKNINLNGMLTSAVNAAGKLGGTPLRRTLDRVTGYIDKAKDLIKNPPIGALKSLAMGGMGRLLSSRGIMSALPPGLGSALRDGLKLGSSLGLGHVGSGNGSSVLKGLGGIISGLGQLGVEKLGQESLPSFGEGCSGSDLDAAIDEGGDHLRSLLGHATERLRSSLTRRTSRGTSQRGHLMQFVGQQALGLISGVPPFISGRSGMITALRASACTLCPSFGDAIAKLTKSACIPHEDCLGIDCDVRINHLSVRAKVSVSLKVIPDQRKVNLKVNGEVQGVTGNDENTFTIPLKIFGVETELKFKVTAKWQGKDLRLSLSLRACALGHCLPDINVLRDLRFDGNSRRKRSIGEMLGPFLGRIESLPLDDVTKMFSDFSLPMQDLAEQVTGVQDQIRSALQISKDQTGLSMTAEFVTPNDFKDDGNFPIKGENGENYMPFFLFKMVYPLGPVLFHIDFDAGGAFGISFDVKVLALDSALNTEIKPWASGKFRASMSVSIGVASGGIDLTGWVMKTAFPLTLKCNYSKQPVVTTKTLEVELIPIELILRGWVKILFVINIHKNLWHYTASALRGTIWEKQHRKDDQGPPRFPYCGKACSSSSPTQTPGPGFNCSVLQVKGRHPRDAAFRLEFAVEDEDSDLSLSYAVGDYPGGTNVQGWTTMRGNSLLSPAELPCGIPLHFLVKARNSQGLETTARCSIPTFDCTFPDGRVDASHSKIVSPNRCSSHPSRLKSQVILFDDSQLQPDKLFHGVGYSPSSFGHEVVHWQPLTLHNSLPQPGVSGDLRWFTGSHSPFTTLSPNQVSLVISGVLTVVSCHEVVHWQPLTLHNSLPQPGVSGDLRWFTGSHSPFTTLSPSQVSLVISGVLTVVSCHEVVHWQPLTLHNSLPQPGVSGDLRWFTGSHSPFTTLSPSQVSLVISGVLTVVSCHEVVHWQPLTLHNSLPQPGVSGDLRLFSAPRSGRLSASPKQSVSGDSAATCATACVTLSTCVTFVYNPYLHQCELHEVTEGANAERKADANYETYERLGKSYTAILRYENLLLRHGTKYYVNTDVENVLGYRATLTSQGTMVDMTPPEPGPVGDVTSDYITVGGCNASIIQRCEDHVTNSLNHRKVIDGAGSRTVFNGNRKGQEMKFTMENYHAAANWDGFKDAECGIHGYTWSVGTTLCGTDVVSFVDPHASIPNPNDWTYTGLARDLQLPNGAYYVTVQAVSDVIHGGDLVTSVCHSAPFTVDTTPPNFHSVKEFLFDDSFRFLAVYYNVSDDTSGVARMEFGLGRTKYDVMIRKYLPFEMRGVEGNTYIVNEEFETEDGSPAWIRLKVVNSVGLSATGAGETPVLLDSTPPVAGQVMDGTELGHDICCQVSANQICAQWADFYDPDSSIDSYLWGVGLTQGKDDVVTFHMLTAYEKQSCKHVTLQHNVTYFSTVVANNKALNQKSANASSDGLLVDITSPVSGIVSDGNDVMHDVNYTSETATVTTSWIDFYDPESGLADYTLSVTINNNMEKTFTGISDNLEVFSDHSFSLEHGDSVVVTLQANNRAGGQVRVSTDGMLVDHTPPELVDLGTENRTLYQQSQDVLHFLMEFDDPESGVEEYRCVVFEAFHGTKSKIWPELSDFHPISLNVTSSPSQQLHLPGLSLQNGAAYNLKVTAVNRAKMATAEESEAVTVDTTPPDILKVLLAREGEEEETNDAGQVEHVDKEPLWVTWSPHDSQSGIKTSHLCIGPDGSDDCLSSPQVLTVDGSLPATLSFRDLHLQISNEQKQVLYRVYLVVINGAGIASGIVTSKPFLLLHANVAGVVSDGRDDDDVDFSHDTSSIAITFSGFSSQACGIAGYEWGVGTSPFATNVLPYTDYGLVVDDAGNGFAQVDVMQFEGQTYYSSVRATTGHNCHEQYIVASSDGFTVDTTPPTASFRIGSRLVTSHDVVYQVTSDHLDVMWEVRDPSGLNETRMRQDVFDSNSLSVNVPAVPEDHLALRSRISSGDSLFPALMVTDNAGNEASLSFPTVTLDFTPPDIIDLRCSKVVSSRSSLLSCDWETINETHSALSEILIGLGNGPSKANIINMTSVPRHIHHWSYDVNSILESQDIKDFFVIVGVTNAAGLKKEIPVKVMRDVSPPSVDEVIIVTSPGPGHHDVKQQCQTTQDYMEILLKGVTDKESEIGSVELALGSSPGRSDVRGFRVCGEADGMYVMERLALSAGATVYVTARITNTVGLYVIATSDAVVISPEPRLEVSDGPDESDRDGQSEVHVLEGRWRYSDPCPVLLAQWSVLELAGQPLTNFTHIPDTATYFYNDALHLDNFKTYISYVRIVDALNRTRTAYSDGVTVLISRPDTATVRDGLGDNDIDFQQHTDTLAANWDEFGDARSTLPSNHIIRYMAAVGTDIRHPESRSDIHAFEDVGLNTSIAFYGLNLTAKTQTYYVTVRAYSAAGSYVESSSDGIRGGFSGDVTAGHVDASAYQSSTDSLRFWWVGFDSDMVITHYYAGISSQPPAWDNDTHDCSVFLHNHTDLFDVRPLEVLAEESLAVLDHLSLEHGKSYYVTVMAADRMGHCSAAASGRVLVDTTPPVKGQVRAEGFNAKTVIFVHSPQTLVVKLDDFPDPESGVQTVTLDLVSSITCSPDTDPDRVQLVRSVQAENQTVVFFRNLQLVEKTLYFVRVTVRNGAGLDTRATSRPVLLDTTPPRPGLVKLGKDWTGADQTFQPHTHTVSAVIAVQSVYRSPQDCVTQVDLLSPNTRHNWTSKEGEFSARSVGFDEAGLQVMVQHNPYLTGVDRGAAQFGPIAWREGTYKFRLSPASGDDIITGIALTSSTLQPPFAQQNGLLPGNESSLPCSTSDGVCPEDRNQTLKPGHVGNDEDYGVGLTFLTREGGVRLLLWAQDALQLKHTWVPVDFDLAASTAHYSLTLTRGRGEVWEVSVGVNGQSKASVSGLVLSGPCVLTVYGWNVNDSFPPVLDPFRPFRAVTILRALSLPLHPPPPCSHGNPFTDLTSDLAQVWVGISDSYNTTSNVDNDTLFKSFCLPCLQQCTDICSGCRGEHLSDDFTLLPLTLRGLRLQAGDRVFANTSLRSNDSASSDNGNDTAWDDPAALNASKEEMSEFQLPTYYLHVRVVDHSGLETVVRSPGLVIDTSPPVVKSLYCFNPHFSKDVEIAFLGNNHSVGVTWEVSEDISDVTEVRVSLGSRPGDDDIIPKVAVDENHGQYIFTGLEPHLEEGNVYFITLQAENEAGLVSEAWTNFTLHTSPPDMTAYHVTMGNVTSVTVEDVTLGVTENTDQLELDLDVDPTIAQQVDIEYYELAIGTREGKDDVFPQTVVGLKGAKKVAIVNGFVHRDETPDQISVGDYTKKNISTEDLPDPTANLFNMEPGRCLTQRLYGVSKAHIATSFDVIPLCVKRRDDVMLTADNVTHVLQLNGSGLDIDAAHDDADALKVSIKLKKGAIIAGVLSDSDMSEQYGSAASAEFSPFVVLPDPVVDPVSRWLKKRLLKIPGPSMYVSPVAEAEFADDLTVTYRVPATVLVPGDSTVSLLFWNADFKQWEAPEEKCSVDPQSYNNLTRTVTAKLCPGVFSGAESTDMTVSGGRRKRSTSQLHTTPPLQPRMLTLAVIRSSVPNLPPVVRNTTFTLLEDHGIYNFTLTYTDPEGDDMTFWLPQQPAHGTAKVTPEGKVTYIPAPNYSGMDTIHLKGREVVSKATQSLGVVPNEVSFTITVHITDTNDPPDIFYVPVKGQNDSDVRQDIAVGPTAGNGLNMTVYIEANTTTHAVLGLVVFSDVDLNDVINYTSTTHIEAGAKFEVDDVSSDDTRLSDVNMTSATGTNGKEISINVTKGYTGHVSYDARVNDAAGTFSMQLTLNVFVLNSPCVHGDCQPRDPQGTCYEHQRAFTFDSYACHCDLGYEGEWCEIETDECRTATCSPITDCVDLIGGYRCDVNTLKTVAIVVCCVLAVLLVALAVFKLKKRPSKVDVWPLLRHSLGDDLKKPEPFKQLEEPAATSSTLSGIDFSPMTPEQLDVSLPPMSSQSVHVTSKHEEEEEFEFMKQTLFTFRPAQNPTAWRPFVPLDLLESDVGGPKTSAAKLQQVVSGKSTATGQALRVTAVASTAGTTNQPTATPYRLPRVRLQRQHTPAASHPAKKSSWGENTATGAEAHESTRISTIEPLEAGVNAARSRCYGPASLDNEVDMMTSRPMLSSSNGRHSVYTRAGGEKELTKVEL
ncbi:uncharacterized protein [Littorina saxatilis]|uniref:uncharacterized protein n=1 Tax=Littorina saxatilis TaxID=31220 RepID=UPI0038B6AD00